MSNKYGFALEEEEEESLPQQESAEKEPKVASNLFQDDDDTGLDFFKPIEKTEDKKNEIKDEKQEL